MSKMGGRAQLDDIDHMRTSVSYRVGPVFQLFEIIGRILKLSGLISDLTANTSRMGVKFFFFCAT